MCVCGGFSKSLQAVKSFRGSLVMKLTLDVCFGKVTGRNQTGSVIVQRGCWRKEVNLIVPGMMRA